MHIGGEQKHGELHRGMHIGGDQKHSKKKNIYIYIGVFDMPRLIGRAINRSHTVD